MKIQHGMCFVAVVGCMLLAAAGAWAQTQPTSLTISPLNPTLNVGETQQFEAQSGNVLNLSESSAIATGYEHTCALLSDGAAECWGWNSSGQLGDGTKDDSSLPITVSLGGGRAVAIAAGADHTCALLADGTTKCWGYNRYGELGDGNSRTASSTPVSVKNLSGVVAISTGADDTCAVRADGTAKCWGSNSSGQLGDGTTGQDRTTPVTVTGKHGLPKRGALDLAAGAVHTCAVLADGTARCWGSNSNGQLGDNGTETSSGSPVAVSGLSGAISIASGALANHSCALLADGTAECWGRNDYGQLGDGTKTDAYTPVSTEALVLSVKWSSSNTRVATIGAASGVAKAEARGKTTITAAYGALSANTPL